jgi:hypothetical protein
MEWGNVLRGGLDLVFSILLNAKTPAMRISFLLLIFMPLIALQNGLGQTTSDCEGAVLLCDDYYFEENAALGTGDVVEYTGACNSGTEWSSVWYQFTVQEDGLLSFIIEPINPADDYDWGLFDITFMGCFGIGNELLSPEVGCNSYGVFGDNGPTGISTANGGTGDTNGPGNLNGPPFNADLPVTAGQTFALVVMNWSQSLEGYGIDFGGSTASLYDEVSPAIDSASAACSLDTLYVHLSENVLTSTIEPTDFTLISAATGAAHGFTAADWIDSGSGTTSSVSLVVDPATPIMSSGEYSVQLTDVSGSVTDACGNWGTGAFPMFLEVLTPPWSWVDYELEVCPDEPTAFDATFGLPGDPDPATSYVATWTYDAGGNAAPDTLAAGVGPFDLVVNSMGDGIYSVQIQTNPACYSATSSLILTTVECAITIPNVITPRNGDPLNDGFRVDGLDRWPGSSVKVFNRWGDLVYSNSRFDVSAGWSPSPADASEGTYFYELVIPTAGQELRVTTLDGETTYPPSASATEVRISGAFTLVR